MKMETRKRGKKNTQYQGKIVKKFVKKEKGSKIAETRRGNKRGKDRSTDLEDSKQRKENGKNNRRRYFHRRMEESFRISA